MFIVRLITEAREAQTVVKEECIAKLLGLRRKDIKSRELHVLKIHDRAVLDFMQENARANAREILFLECHLRHGQQHILNDIVAVDMELALILALIHEVSNLAHDPDDAEDMVRMAVRHEHMMAFLIIEARKFELAQNAVAAACIRQEQVPIIERQIKTRIVALRHHGIARAEHRKFSHNTASYPDIFFHYKTKVLTMSAPCFLLFGFINF